MSRLPKFLINLCTMSLLAFSSQALLANSEVPKPAAVLGFELGEWHVRHDQIENYFKELAKSAPTITHLEVIGRTHQQRPLLQLVIANERNLANLAQIRERHLAIARGEAEPDPALPLIIWMGYGVHGNESSGPNAALAYAYELVAQQTDSAKQTLENAIILLQPSLNPDGHDRFATWANMHQGTQAVADPQHREHVEPWPNGRPNHYWFDLNRDWLPLQHPESRARIQQFQKWLPQVVADFHEMGPDSTYFFQPGIPSRNNPNTPSHIFDLTAKIATFHAKAMDQQQALYFTEEAFDDFYVGKGSTYPDVQGSVGILFEQASSRGHLQDTINGPLAFRTTIDQQVLMSRSTLAGAIAHKTELQQQQANFFRAAQQEAKSDPVQGFVVSEEQDASRMSAFLHLLAQHDIKAYQLTADLSQQGQMFKQGSSYFIPLKQRQYRLIKAAFSTETNFRDNTFYDVSAWTLPYGYNLNFSQLRHTPNAVAAKPWQANTDAKVSQAPQAGAYAYALKWHDQQAPVMLAALLQKGIQVRSAVQPFSALTAEGVTEFAAGTMLIPAGLQSQGWFDTLLAVQQQFGLPLQAITTGLTPTGSDLGSRTMVPVTLPHVLLLAGPGINSTEAGELWFSLERLAGISPSLIEPQRFARIDLSRYSHIVLPDGNYSSWQDKDIQALKAWVTAGGVVWGQKSAALWLSEQGILQAKAKRSSELAALIPVDTSSYADKEKNAGKKRIAGAIYGAQFDLTHPLTFGLPRAQLPVFKNDVMLLQPSQSAYVTVGRYQDKPQLAGFTSPEYVEQIRQAAALLAHNQGKGRVIAMTDNPVFRGYFVGSGRLLVNAMYLAKAFDTQEDGAEGEAD